MFIKAETTEFDSRFRKFPGFITKCLTTVWFGGVPSPGRAAECRFLIELQQSKIKFSKML